MADIIERTCGMREFAIPAGIFAVTFLGIIGATVLAWVIAR